MRVIVCVSVSRWKVIYIIISYRCGGGGGRQPRVGEGVEWLLRDDLAQENRDKHPVGGVRRGGMRAFFSRLYAQAAYIQCARVCVCVCAHIGMCLVVV